MKCQTLCNAALRLQYLHERGIVHGALTCDNILIGESGSAKLGGFELQATVKYTTRRVDARLKAPECVQGEAVSPAADIYSFATCVVEAVTGKEPWNSVVVGQKTTLSLNKASPGFRLLLACRQYMNDQQFELIAKMCNPSPVRGRTSRTWSSSSAHSLRRVVTEPQAWWQR